MPTADDMQLPVAVDEGAAEVVPALSEHHSLRKFRDNTGQSVEERSQAAPVLLVFLRHFGCTFCREALADLAKLQVRGLADAQLVLVHMVSSEEASAVLGRYGHAQTPHISDPQRQLYMAMGLRRGTMWQLFGWRTWLRGFVAGVLKGHLVGKLAGDGFAMPGVFVVSEGRVVRAFRHESAADVPDYCALARWPESALASSSK